MTVELLSSMAEYEICHWLAYVYVYMRVANNVVLVVVRMRKHLNLFIAK